MSSTSTKANTRNKKRRPGDPWISKNRVLIGGGGARMKHSLALGRNPNFDTEETKILIQLWGDPKIQRQLITTHKKYTVIAELSAKMEDYGYFRTPEEITTRIKNLKCIYNRLKKEVDSGEWNHSKPSWRHYEEMDAVMSRPIFSVRPNEVPAPSIKFQIEQELERRKERKRKILEEGGSMSESEDEDIIDILAFTEPLKRSQSKSSDGGNTLPDNNDNDGKKREEKLKKSNRAKSVDNKVDKQKEKLNDEELLIKMEIEAEEFITDRRPSSGEVAINKTINNKTTATRATDYTKDDTNKAKQNKNNNNNNNNNNNYNNKDSDDDVLLIPKMEPIDVDAEDGSSCESLCLPTVVPLNATTLTTIAGHSVTSSLTTLTTTTASGAICRASSSCSTTNTHQGKISLVPTNFLMQPTVPGTMSSQPQIRLLPNASGQLQPHLVLSAAAASGVGTTANNAGIVTTGPGGMKLLLVNAEQAGKGNSTNPLTMTMGNKQAATVNTNINQQLQQHHQQLTVRATLPHTDTPQVLHSQQFQTSSSLASSSTTNSNAMKQTIEVDNDNRDEGDDVQKKDFHGIRLLIGKLLNAQKLNNEYEKQRLELERERLDFEKCTAEKFLNVFNQHLQQQTHLQQQVISIQQRQAQYSAVPPLLSTAAVTSIPNGPSSSTLGATHLRLNPKVIFTTVSSAAGATLLGSNVLTTSSSLSNIITSTSATTTVQTPLNSVNSGTMAKSEPNT